MVRVPDLQMIIEVTTPEVLQAVHRNHQYKDHHLAVATAHMEEGLAADLHQAEAVVVAEVAAVDADKIYRKKKSIQTKSYFSCFQAKIAF